MTQEALMPFEGAVEPLNSSEYSEALQESSAPSKADIELWTIQLAQWRKAIAQGLHLLDTTAKSGEPEFAPDFELVMQFKRHQLDEETYTRYYTNRMEISQLQSPEHWAGLAKWPKIAVACYCKPGDFCHRRIFVKLAKDYLEKKGLTVALKGELR